MEDAPVYGEVYRPVWHSAREGPEVLALHCQEKRSHVLTVKTAILFPAMYFCVTRDRPRNRVILRLHDVRIHRIYIVDSNWLFYHSLFKALNPASEIVAISNLLVCPPWERFILMELTKFREGCGRYSFVVAKLALKSDAQIPQANTINA